MKRAWLLLLLAAPAAAQSPSPPPDETPPQTDGAPSELDLRLHGLEERLAALETENQRLKQRMVKAEHPRIGVFNLADGLTLRLSGYADIGFYKPFGDGVAYVRDAGHVAHPELANYPWVFLGDPWANAVNSQGDSADLGLDRSNIARYDPIHSHGKASFIVNMVNLGLSTTIGEHFFFEASLGFEPRQGTLGTTGDSVDLDLAYLEYRPSRRYDIHLYLGKFESTFGIEYRNRKAPDRFGITPSLISRYTTGTPTGIKLRGSAFGGILTYNLALTNGGMSTEKFAHFYQETAQNDFKTVSGRLSLGKSFGRWEIEVGASGLVGAQASQTRDDILGWQVGADVRLRIGDFNLRGEYVHVIDQGGGLEQAPSLRADGMYAEATYQVLPWLGVLGRVDYRNAKVAALPNLYLSDDLRFTAGLRFDIVYNIIAKAEYVRVQELSGPEIDDDVFTTSVVLRF